MSDVKIDPKTDAQIRHKLSAQDVKAYEHAVQKLRNARPGDSHRLLTTVKSNRFRDRGIKYTMRASKKYRVLLGQEGTSYVVVGLANRGDHRYYPQE